MGGGADGITDVELTRLNQPQPSICNLQSSIYYQESSTSRTFRASPSTVKGFWRKATLESRMP
jgi:hypothetical protein